MTRSAKTRDTTARPPGHWPLQDAKAHFSELVRRASRDGPQHVTVRGREEVVVVSAEEFRRLTGGRSGKDLIEALQSCPHPDFAIEPAHELSPVRDVEPRVAGSSTRT